MAREVLGFVPGKCWPQACRRGWGLGSRGFMHLARLTLTCDSLRWV